ncbi:MAG: rRNA maturation RNase YbeY [Arsenophonus sp.]
MKQVILDLQVVCVNNNGLPNKTIIQHWLNSFLPEFKSKSEITIRIVDIAESKRLNLTYRRKNKATNVLSFPFKAIDNIASPLLGDLIICRQVVENESFEQQKTLYAHLAHMIIHGCLHLLGYDHQNNFETKKMETAETKILQKLGYFDPYQNKKL